MVMIVSEDLDHLEQEKGADKHLAVIIWARPSHDPTIF